MTTRIAVAGKGGTGKTTFCALLIKILLSQNKKPILAVDADPNSNLAELLGINYDSTIADVREELREQKDITLGMVKADYINMRLNEIISEANGLDLIVMGRPEGRECYCYINELLRNFLSKISKNYNTVVIDNEAGMEHLSRRTTDDIDTLFIISEPTLVSLKSAEKIKELAEKIKLKIKNIYLVLNKVKNQDSLEEIISKTYLKPKGIIPYDENILKLSESGKNLFSVEENSHVLSKIKDIITDTLG